MTITLHDIHPGATITTELCFDYSTLPDLRDDLKQLRPSEQIEQNSVRFFCILCPLCYVGGFHPRSGGNCRRKRSRFNNYGLRFSVKHLSKCFYIDQE